MVIPVNRKKRQMTSKTNSVIWTHLVRLGPCCLRIGQTAYRQRKQDNTLYHSTKGISDSPSIVVNAC